MLLKTVSIQLDSTARRDGIREIDLLPYITQKPNSKLFGKFNWRLGIYNLSKRNSTSWLNRRLRAWGEAPVIYEDAEGEAERNNLTTALYNMGYLDAQVQLHLDTLSEKKLRTRYELSLGRPYPIAHHEQLIKDEQIQALLAPRDTLREKKDFSTERYSTHMTLGSYLSPNAMQAERKRIAQILRNRGHWGFREEHIHFDVDTTGGQHNAWVRTVIDTISRTYRIGQVRVFHNVEPKHLHSASEQSIEGVTYYNKGYHYLRPKFLDRRIWVRPGDLYRQDLISRTYSALTDLSAIRSANIRYSLDSSNREPSINVDIITEAEKSKELTADVVGTHSGGNLGAMASLTFQHNNIFRGAETLRLSGHIGYEDLSARRDHLSYGIDASLSFPKLIIPTWRGGLRQRPLKGSTDISLSYSYLTRPEFSRNLFSTSWAYHWTLYRQKALRYVLKLLEIDYMHFGYMDERFISTVPDYDRLLNYRNQLVLGASFMMSYNSRKDYRYLGYKSQHNIRLYLQTAGNLLTSYTKLLGKGQDAQGTYTFLGANILQFFKGELDYSGLYSLGGKNRLAYHAAVSAVVPYGNSSLLPIDFRYFAGGSSSQRGWGARTLGPGSMPKALGSSIFHQVGDIKIDLSTELRLRVAPSWELALFADAGNIWTIRRYAEQPGGEFNFGRFYKELALSTGMGLRWDLNYFLLRLDAGLKVHDPQQAKGSRWVLGKEKLKDLVGLHIALGYPF